MLYTEDRINEELRNGGGSMYHSDSINPQNRLAWPMKAHRIDSTNTTNWESMGAVMGESLPYPDHVDSIMAAFHELSKMVDDQLTVEPLGPRYLRITSTSPYLDDFEFGLIWATARRYRPARSTVMVYQEGAAPWLNQYPDEHAVYHISW